MSLHNLNSNVLTEQSILNELVFKKPETKGFLNKFLNWLRKEKKFIDRGSFYKLSPELSDRENQIVKEFEQVRNEHRLLSEHYNVQYNVSYRLNYSLAVWAVSLAVLSLGLLYCEHTFQGSVFIDYLETVVIILGIIKLAILLLIYLNTTQAQKYDFNKRAVVYRLLMEQFRHMLYLPLFGIHRLPTPSAGRFLSRHWEKSYLQKYFNEKVNEALSRLYGNTIDHQTEINYSENLATILRYVQTRWIKAQMNYHEEKAKEQAACDEHLEMKARILNVAVIVLVSLDVLLSIFGLFFLPKYLENCFEKVGAPIVLIIAAIIPTMIASYNATRFQTEAKKIAERSSFMRDLLFEIDKKYEALIKKIENTKNTSGSFTIEAIALVNETAQTMIDELTEWSFIYAKDVMDS